VSLTLPRNTVSHFSPVVICSGSLSPILLLFIPQAPNRIQGACLALGGALLEGRSSDRWGARSDTQPLLCHHEILPIGDRAFELP